MCTENHNQVKSLRYGVTQCFFCHLGPFFSLLPLPPLFSLTPQKTKILEKGKKHHCHQKQKYVFILNLCNKKHNQMMHAYSDMEYDRQCFVILGHFLLFYPTIEPEN